jgi:hypothetical protein
MNGNNSEKLPFLAIQAVSANALLLKSLCIYRVSKEECARLREGVPYVEVCQYSPKHLCPKLNVYVDNG